MKRVLGTILIALLVAVLYPVSAVASGSNQVNRLRVVFTTTSDWARLNVPTEDRIVIADTALISGSAMLVSKNDTALFIGQNTLGSQSSAQYDFLLTTDGLSDGNWRLEKGWGQSARVDIYNVNDASNPVLIASHTNNAAQGDVLSFTLGGQDESRHGPLQTGSLGEKKVFGVYCPWYSRSDVWGYNPRFIDRPSIPYGTENQGQVNGVVQNARDAGLDGFLVSWQGSDHFADRGLRTVLNAANQRYDFTVAVYLETRVANAAHSETQPPDPAYLRQWLADVIRYGNDPANTSYQKMNGKPVIFIYWAKDLSPERWKQEVFDPLRAQGLDAYYIADYTGSVSSSYRDYLGVFDGMHMFNPASYANYEWVIATRAAETKTYSSFANPGAERKMWVGTAYPGKDARIYGPEYEPYLGELFIDRRNGGLYDDTWRTNIAQEPDWMMVTTWNDYFMNTHVEDSQTYGSYYLNKTRTFADQFKSTQSGPPPVLSGISGTGFLPGGMEIDWSSDRPASTVVEYGTSSGVYTNVVRSQTSTVSHSAVISSLRPGTYYIRVRSRDGNGLETMGNEFTVTVPDEEMPDIRLTPTASYWSDYASYTAGLLSVDFQVDNQGATGVRGIRVLRASAGSGVMPAGELPVVGDIGSGGSSAFTIRWKLPTGVSSFSVNLWAQATTESGSPVYYPEVPPASS